MNYRDEFLLRAENYGDPQAVPLYARYTPEGVPGPANIIPIRLSDTKDTNCRWTTMPLLPCDRLEGLGSPIKVYSNRVLLGNWYEAAQLEEYKLNKLNQMDKGELLLARYRKMKENLDKPSVITQSLSTISFGAKVTLLAPHVPATDPAKENIKGLLLGGRISANEINYSQDLEDGCTVVCLPDKKPKEMSTFVLTSADYCNRDGELLKYNQEFLLALSSSVAKKPLYLRYDKDVIPGLCGQYPLYLSKHPVSSTRWRILPVQTPNITRFELEGKPLNVNTDIVINHCSTNVNLGVNLGCWVMGFFGKVCAPLMKTCLDVYGRETPNNIWQIYIPIADDETE